MKSNRLTALASTVETSRSTASNSPSQPRDRQNLTFMKSNRLTALAETVETSSSTASNSPPPKDRQNWQRLARKWGLNCIWLIGAIGLSQLAIVQNAQAATSTLIFTNNPPTQITTGTGANISAIGVGTTNGGTVVGAGAATVYRVGDVYRFTNVFSGIDALVTIQGAVGGAKLRLLDDNSVFPNRFQPIIEHPGTLNTNAHIQFDVQLVLAGTLTPATAINVYFSAQDIDGSGANSIREFVGIKGAQSTVLANPTLLQPFSGVPSIPGFVTYEQISAANTQAGIGIGNEYEFYSFIAASASNFSIIGGNALGSAACVTANLTGIGTCQRQNSYTFDASDVQRLDFGDAPLSYGDAYHSVPPTPTVRLGANVSGDDAPVHTPNADGDTLDDGVASFPLLSTAATSYALNVTCAGTGTFVAGWIDFNRNGTFDPGERASGTCNGTTVALNWTGISGIVAGQTYARFRTATLAAEVTNPTGSASDGEVEDYTLNINLKASVLLVKRITAINGLTTNDGINLAAVTDNAATTNDDPTKKWPANYLQGTVNAGRVKPGDTIEYTVYYLNDEGATTTSLKICDPIKGNQTYVSNSLKLLPGGASNPAGIIALTDLQDAPTIDRANSYLAGAAPTNCNAIGSTAAGADSGGVTIQLIGTGGSSQPNLPNIPAATAVGTPANSYGWFRFTTKVKP